MKGLFAVAGVLVAGALVVSNAKRQAKAREQGEAALRNVQNATRIHMEMHEQHMQAHQNFMSGQQ